jgi:hypothetical protein
MGFFVFGILFPVHKLILNAKSHLSFGLEQTLRLNKTSWLIDSQYTLFSEASVDSSLFSLNA